MTLDLPLQDHPLEALKHPGSLVDRGVMITAMGRRLSVVAVTAACFGAGPLAFSASAEECPPAGCSQTDTTITEVPYIEYWGSQDDAPEQGYAPAPLPEPLPPEPEPEPAPAPEPEPAPAPAPSPRAPAAGQAPQHPAEATSKSSSARSTGTAPAAGDPADVAADVPVAAESSVPAQPPSPGIPTEAATTPERLDTTETAPAASAGTSDSLPVASSLSALALVGAAVGGVLHGRRRSRRTSPEV